MRKIKIKFPMLVIKIMMNVERVCVCQHHMLRDEHDSAITRKTGFVHILVLIYIIHIFENKWQQKTNI